MPPRWLGFSANDRSPSRQGRNDGTPLRSRHSALPQSGLTPCGR
jgi:hypothetical protein